MSETYDLLVTGGTVLNPAAGLRQQLDVGVKDGRVAALQAKLPRAEAKRVIEVAALGERDPQRLADATLELLSR